MLILNSGRNITKCGIQHGVGILSEGTVHVCERVSVSVQNRVNAGNIGSHLMNYYAVLWLGDRSCLGACWSETRCSGTACRL